MRAFRGGCCTRVDIAFQNTGRGKVQIGKNKLLSENRILSVLTSRKHFHVFSAFSMKHVHSKKASSTTPRPEQDEDIAPPLDDTEHIIDEPKKLEPWIT